MEAVRAERQCRPFVLSAARSAVYRRMGEAHWAANSKPTPSEVARQLVTFLVLPRKVTKRNRPPGAPLLRSSLRARLIRPPHKLARSAARPRAQTYSSEFPDQSALLGGAQGKEKRKFKTTAWAFRAPLPGLFHFHIDISVADPRNQHPFLLKK